MMLMDNTTNSKLKEHTEEEKQSKITEIIKKGYAHHYKILMTFTLLIVLLAVAQVSYQYATTGDIINKAVSINGGLTITISTENREPLDQNVLIKALKEKFPENYVEAKTIDKGSKQLAVTVEADVTEKEGTELFIQIITETTGIAQKDLNIEITGSSLGTSFFKDLMVAIGIAFLLMGLTVLIYLRTPIPSMAVILCAFSDIICTLAVVNLSGMKVGTAGIVGFLLLIGYSVDTDILLTVRVLKRKEGYYLDRIIDALKTGLTMTLTTLAAVVVALFLSKSEVITQIMTVLMIGLFFDMLFTWIQNVGLLRLYLDYKERKDKEVKQ